MDRSWLQVTLRFYLILSANSCGLFITAIYLARYFTAFFKDRRPSYAAGPGPVLFMLSLAGLLIIVLRGLEPNTVRLTRGEPFGVVYYMLCDSSIIDATQLLCASRLVVLSCMMNS